MAEDFAEWAHEELEDEERRAAIIRRARTEGLEIAYEAALRICRDPKAPAQAQSNACRTLLQIAGAFEKPEGPLNKQPYDMTGEELAEAARKIVREGQKAAPSNVFG